MVDEAHIGCGRREVQVMTSMNYPVAPQKPKLLDRVREMIRPLPNQAIGRPRTEALPLRNETYSQERRSV